jgi:hypothetical protein
MSFPSFGYILAVPPERVAAVRSRFLARDIACTSVGRCDDIQQLRLCAGEQQALFWDLTQEPLIGCSPAARAGA